MVRNGIRINRRKLMVRRRRINIRRLMVRNGVRNGRINRRKLIVRRRRTNIDTMFSVIGETYDM